MIQNKTKKEFKVLLIYPNLSMLLTPPLSMAIFTSLLRNAGYCVDLFDTTPYIGEGTSSVDENVSVGEEMNTMRKKHLEIAQNPQQLEPEIEFTFQAKTVQETMIETMQARSFSYESDLKFQSKLGLYDDFKQKVDEFKPDLMLVSVVEDTFLQAVKLISLVYDKDISILVGGVFTTANPELAISYPMIEMIGIGEGEQIVLDVAERIFNGRPCDDVPGVWIKKKSGKIIRNPRGPLFDFTKIIPDFSLFEDVRFYRPMGGKFFKSIPLESYRGCPYTCAYCNSPMQSTLAKDAGIGDFVRRSEIERVRDYIANVIEQVHPTFFMFIDDSFLARPSENIEAFCKMYEEFKIPFWFNTRPENITLDRLKMLKEINCYRMSFGLECGNEKFREKHLLRKVSNKKLIQKFEILANGDIPFSINNIIGFPDEDRKLIFETIELNREIPYYDALTVSVFVPYHGTVLRKYAEKLGYIHPESIVCDLFHTTLDMPQLSAQEIDGLLRTFPLYVYFSKSFWPDIERAEINDEEGNRIFHRLSEKYHNEAFSHNQDEKMAQTKKVTGSIGCASNDLDSIRI